MAQRVNFQAEFDEALLALGAIIFKAAQAGVHIEHGALYLADYGKEQPFFTTPDSELEYVCGAALAERAARAAGE